MTLLRRLCVLFALLYTLPAYAITLEQHASDPNAHTPRDHAGTHYATGSDQLTIELLYSACAANAVPVSNGDGTLACGTALGDIVAVGSCTISSCAVEGGSDIFPLIYEGTADSFETTISFVDPSADNSITVPNRSGTVTMQLVDSPTAQRLPYFDSTGRLTTSVLTWDVTNVRLGINTTTPSYVIDAISNASDTAPQIRLQGYGNTTPWSAIILQAARGTSASPTGVQSGNTLSSVFTNARDSAGSTSTGAEIRATATETWSGTIHGTKIDFLHARTGATALSTDLSIAGVGAVVLGGTTTTSGAGAGDLVLANSADIRFNNAAGTSATSVLSVDILDTVVLAAMAAGEVVRITHPVAGVVVEFGDDNGPVVILPGSVSSRIAPTSPNVNFYAKSISSVTQLCAMFDNNTKICLASEDGSCADADC
jgi:hypothetical protein